MRHVQNAPESGAADQALEESALLQEHGDEAKVEGCGGHKLVCGYGIKPGMELGRRDG